MPEQTQSATNPRPPMWYERSYSRILIDNHITDDDPEYMSRFDPAGYVSMVEKAGVDAAMVYACCHNGNCYYPTRVGHMHAGLGGRDIFGEVVSLLASEGITPLAYYTTIFHNQSAKDNPSWRMVSPVGQSRGGRYWYTCPNSRDNVAFAKLQLGEIIAYPVAGIFVDMVFWPMVCVCENCRNKYRTETGLEIPETIDWSDPAWVRFQKARERWMAEFVEELRESVISARPDMTVTFQFSPVLHGWSLGQSPAIAAACDYASGDFYGGRDQQSLGTKVLAAFSKNAPYEFMTSRCTNLRDHTSNKSEDELFCHVAMTLANAGAYFFIDAINPDGTLEDDVYSRLGRVSAKARPFTERVAALRPAGVADVGLYFSMANHVDGRFNGVSLKDAAVGSSNMAPNSAIGCLRETQGAAVVLGKSHVPYKVITSDRPDFGGLTSLVINNAAYMSTDEVEAVRRFVADGGVLIATGSTSLYDLDGAAGGDFALADVFGVTHTGELSERVSYLCYDGEPDTPPSEKTTSGGSRHYVAIDGRFPLVSATTAEVLARVCGPFTDPDDPDHYASIHSNPPGPITEFAGLTVNRFGKGKCIYLSAPLFASGNHAQRTFLARLVGQHVHSSVLTEVDAPGCVEVTVLKSSVEGSYLLCFVNYQAELPNVPVRGVSATVKLPGGVTPAGFTRLSDGKPAEVETVGGAFRISVPELETLEIVEIGSGV